MFAEGGRERQARGRAPPKCPAAQQRAARSEPDVRKTGVALTDAVKEIGILVGGARA